MTWAPLRIAVAATTTIWTVTPALAQASKIDAGDTGAPTATGMRVGEDQCIAYAQRTQHPEFKDRTIWEVFQEERTSLMELRGPLAY
jgi:hypothetical protein